LFNYNVYAGVASLALTTSYIWHPSYRISSKDIKRNHLEKTYQFFSRFNNLRIFSVSLVLATVFDLAHYESLAEAIAIFSFLLFTIPYLLKPSILIRDKSIGVSFSDKDLWRSFSDIIVHSSLLYAVGAIAAFKYGMPGLGILHIYTCIGSTLFHWTRETMFFNWDNIGAMSLLFVAAYGLYCSFGVDIYWTCSGLMGFPVAIFLLVYCGMPGKVCEEACQKRRVPDPRYHFWHTAWHILSAAGTVLNLHFFNKHFPGMEAAGGQLPFFPMVPMVPAICICCGLACNLLGNVLGAMPLK